MELKKLAKEAHWDFAWSEYDFRDFSVQTAVGDLLAYYAANNLEIPEYLVRGYWKEITGITTAKTEAKMSIKITGKTNANHGQVTHTYEDPDAFLQALIWLYKIKSTITPLKPGTRSTRDSKNFVAKSVTVNKDKYPTNWKDYKSNSVETAEASDSDPGVEISKSSS